LIDPERNALMAVEVLARGESAPAAVVRVNAAALRHW
jgi:hypothetical protein